MVEKKLTLIVQVKNIVRRGLGKAKKVIVGFVKSVGSLALGFVKAFAIMGTAVATVGIALIKVGAQAQEMRSKFAAVFKFMSASAEKFAGDLATSANRSKIEIMGFLASLQDIFVPMGLTRREAAKMSQEMTKLAIDVASFNDVSDKKVIEDFKSAMTGSNEVLKKYGVVITEASIKTEAQRLGLVAANGTLTEAAKVQARFSLLVQGTSDAQGDAARTAGSATNQWKGLKGAVTDANADIGEAILQNGLVAAALGKAKDAVKAFTIRVKEFAASGGFERWHATAKFVLDDTMSRVQWFASATVRVFKNAGKITSNIWRNTTDTIGHFLAKTLAKVQGQKWNIPAPEMRDLLDGVEEIPKRGGDAYAAYQKRLAEIDAQIVMDAKKANAARLKDLDTTLDDAIEAEEIKAARIAALQKDQARLEKEINAAKIKDIQERINRQEVLAKKTVAAFQAGLKAAADQVRAQDADAKKADRLRAKQARGIKLGKKAEAFLFAFGEIERAQKAINPFQKAQKGNLLGQLKLAQAQLQDIKKQGRTLVQIRKELAATNKNLNNLLRMA